MKGKSNLPPKPFLVILGLMLVNPCVAIYGFVDLAYILNLMVIATALAYVVFVDSRKRWPGIPWHKRFTRVVTFYRD